MAFWFLASCWCWSWLILIDLLIDNSNFSILYSSFHTITHHSIVHFFWDNLLSCIKFTILRLFNHQNTSWSMCSWSENSSLSLQTLTRVVIDDLFILQCMHLMSEISFQDMIKVLIIMSLYFFCIILHDWSNEYAVKLLDNIMPALKKKDWIILNKIILLKPDTRSVVIERFCHMANLMILIICNE